MNKQKLLGRSALPIGLLGLYLGVLALSRGWYLQWGTTEAERKQALPGDALMDHASANHAVTIHAPVEAVWPWLVQLGRDRAGFYSYTSLENLVAADIHNSNRIVPEWRPLRQGDSLRLAARKTYGDMPLLRVAALEEGRYIVLDRWGAFVLQPIDAHTTRMLIRSHAQKEGVTHLVSFSALRPIPFIMERKITGHQNGLNRLASRLYMAAKSLRQSPGHRFQDHIFNPARS